MDGISRSPVFSHITATLQVLPGVLAHVQGLSTIHAFDKEPDFRDKCYDLIDMNTRCRSHVFHSFIMSQMLSFVPVS